LLEFGLTAAAFALPERSKSVSADDSIKVVIVITL
jgi:hypothetical protein